MTDKIWSLGIMEEQNDQNVVSKNIRLKKLMKNCIKVTYKLIPSKPAPIPT